MQHYYKNKRQFFVLFLVLGFISGILYENIFARQYLWTTGIFSDYFLQQYKQTEIVAEEYVWYIAKLRVLPFVLICILGCAKWKRILVGIVVSWTGFSLGTLIVSAIMRLGIKGILLCIIGLFPHMIFYVFSYLILLWYLYKYPDAIWNMKKTITVGVAFAVGIILEGYVNTVLMKFLIMTLF